MTRGFLITLLDASIRSAVLVLIVGGLLLAMRVRGSAARHAAWTGLLAAMLVMPVLPWLLPPVPVRIPVPTAYVQFRADEPVAPAIPAPAGANPRPSTSPTLSAVAVPVVVQAGEVAPVRAPFPWMALILTVYLIGAVLLLARLVIGAWHASRVRRRATHVTVSSSVSVAVSTVVSVPMVVGVFRPTVLLPSEWSTWPEAHLQAVLAHEEAHIRRRDPLVLWLAAVNGCVFWFHPLAWWLARTLAATAEHACDEAGARAMGEGRRYAQVLVEMADSVRRRGGRVAWAGVGIDGTGLLGERIDHILRNQAPARLSIVRKAVLVAGCAAAIFLVAACRRQTSSAPLQENPEVSADLAKQQARSIAYRQAVGMTREQVAALEAVVKEHPDDTEGRRKLVTFYRWRGQEMFGWNAMVEARRPHLLWIIEHHPEDELATARVLTPKLDPIGHAEAKKLWLAHTARPAVASRVLGNAALFFQVSDKPIAERVLSKLAASDPGGPTPRTENGIYYSPWTNRLGVLYALAILGSDDETLGNVVKSTSPVEAKSAFANHARQVLAGTRDAALLGAAGSYLTRNATNAKVEFDHVALGTSYLERAVQLDPQGPARRTLLWLQKSEEHQRAAQALSVKAYEAAGGDIALKVRAHEMLTKEESAKVQEARYQVADALPDAERFSCLLDRINCTRNGARDLLALAAKFPADPRHGDAILDANLALGMDALKGGDVKGAVRYMNEAARAPALSEARSLNFFSNLPYDLLKNGERESVAAFFDRAAEMFPSEREGWEKDAADIRAGRMPRTYQHMMAPR